MYVTEEIVRVEKEIDEEGEDVVRCVNISMTEFNPTPTNRHISLWQKWIKVIISQQGCSYHINCRLNIHFCGTLHFNSLQQ